MYKLTADYIYTMEGAPLKEQVLIFNKDGQLLAIEPAHQHEASGVAYHKGVLVPGFINTHCHLELSHLKGRVPTGTQLIPFITAVVQQRGATEDAIQAAIFQADRDMYEAGIVAVGDISNQLDTVACKRQSKMRYYTFVEMFDFMQDASAARALEQYAPVYAQQPNGGRHQRSAVPHAPYSVSKALFQGVNALNTAAETVSIHNQETPPENELFLSKTGDFVDFYRAFDISLDAFEATGQPSLYYALEHMNPACRLLLVHNTISTPADIAAAQAWAQNGVYWATCANANLYIENRLPNYKNFLDADAKVTIGTDSLTSNWQLCVLEELRTISRFQSYVPFETLLTWATINGAEALQMDGDLGSFSVGKTPGVNLLTGLEGDNPSNFRIGQHTKQTRLM